jgi:hypothetical protein
MLGHALAVCYHIPAACGSKFPVVRDLCGPSCMQPRLVVECGEEVYRHPSLFLSSRCRHPRHLARNLRLHRRREGILATPEEDAQPIDRQHGHCSLSDALGLARDGLGLMQCGIYFF